MTQQAPASNASNTSNASSVPEPLCKLYERITLLTNQTIEVGDYIYASRPRDLKPDQPWPATGAQPIAMVVAILYQPHSEVVEYEYAVDDAGNLVQPLRIERERRFVTPDEYLVWIHSTPEGQKTAANGRPQFEGARCQHVPRASVAAADEMWHDALAKNELAIRMTEVIEESMGVVADQQTWSEERQAAAQAAAEQAAQARAVAPAIAPIPAVTK